MNSVLKKELNTDKVLFETNWITVFETENKFQYLQRKGRDSIAVFVTRLNSEDSIEVLIRKQPMPLIKSDLVLYPCPITGGLDNEDDFLYPNKILSQAQVEIEEEGGFTVQPEDIHSLGEYLVGTQTNEKVHMYWCDVTGLKESVPSGDGSIHEQISQNEWVQLKFLKNYQYVACQLGYALLKHPLTLYYARKFNNIDFVLRDK